MPDKPTLIVGSTFWYPLGEGESSQAHLWFVLKIDYSDKFLMANMTDITTARYAATEDCKLFLKDNRHQSITKNSIMNFGGIRKMTKEEFGKKWDDEKIRMDRVAIEETVKYIIDGLMKSKHASQADKDFIEKK